MFRLFFLFFCIGFFGPVFRSFASITKFEFVEEPNSGEHEIKDASDNFGPISLGSYKITITETPADVALMDQHYPVARYVAEVPEDNPDEGVPLPSIDLYEGITYIYLFGRHPRGTIPWVVGPRTFEDGRQLYFVVDQGPPRAPEIGNFFVDGNRIRTSDTSSLSSCATDFTTVHAFYMTCNPSNSSLTAEIIFNSFDNRFTSSLNMSFIGTVTNNTGIFDTNPDEEPNPDPVPGAVDRKESNARVAAQLDRILGGVPTDGPPLTVEYVSDVLSRTGPFALDMSQINLSNMAHPNTDAARSGEPGEFERIGFDVKNLADGNYEIIVGARDAAGNFSPGGFVAFGNEGSPAEGDPTRILVIKDTIFPQKVNLYKPESVFIFGNTPPSVDPPYEDAYWTLSGNVYDERNEMVRVHTFAQDSPDQDGSNETANNQNPDQVFVTNPVTGNFQALIDATAWVPAYPDNNQIAYRWVLVPEDLHGNVNVGQISELFMIKDTTPPPSPYFVDLNDGDAILNPMYAVKGRADNDVTLNTAEHGTVEFVLEMFHETSTGSVGIATYNLPGASSSDPVTDSLLDTSFVSTTIEIPIIDPMGVDTGMVETVNLPDRTEIFNNTVFPEFSFNQIINFNSIPDGLLRFDLCLLDQVGNKSVPCSSVTVFKDLTGPVINFDLQNSGPDDNYDPKFFATLPNFYGADDHEFRISLKSPELTPDPHSSSPTSPIQSDPHFLLPGIPEPDNLALLLKGFSTDSFSSTTNIEVWGSRIQRFELLNKVDAPGGVDVNYSYDGTAFTVNQPFFVASTNVNFEIRLPLFDLLEGVNEVVNLRAQDRLGNWGPTTQVSIIRDVNPPVAPVIMVPPKLSGFSLPVHYTNTDTMTIHGRTEPDARVVIFLPPTGAEAGHPIPPESRIKRTSSRAIPILSSDYNSITTACSQLTCLFPEVEEDGSFYLSGMDISTIAHSLQTATTIYIQAIDSFDNTDPELSVAAIEIHKNNQNVPVEHVFILNYPAPGEENAVQIYPDSLGATPGLTVFFAFDIVDLRVETLFPMLEAPDLKIRQQGYVFKDAGKKSSTFPSQLGTFIFDYTYEIQPQPMEYDGIADFSVSGGRDMFGNQATETADTNAFIVDTVAPNRYTSPVMVLSPLDSTLVTTFVSARVNFTDFFKDTTETENASGVETSSLKINLYGPLHESPDSLHEIALTTFLPAEADFDLGATLAQPLSTDGVYRLEFTGVDRVGNRRKFERSFVLDREAIVAPLLLTNPQHGATVNTMPFDPVSSQFFNSMTILDIEADFDNSGFELFGPGGFLLETVQEARPEESSIYGMFTATSLPLSDGSSDGFYEIHMSVSDKTGNQTTKTHSYLLDTRPMQVTTFYPHEGQCISRLDLVQFGLVEDNSFSAVVAGLDRTKSRIRLLLDEPYEPTNPSSAGRQIQTTIVYRSEDGVSDGADIVMSRVIESGSGLPMGGEFDGVYRIEGEFSDQASNYAAVVSTFIFDSIRPTIDLSGFGDGDFVTRQYFRFEGTVADRGFCGLAPMENSSSTLALSSTSPVYYRTENLSLRAYKWDVDTEQKGELLLGPLYPDYIVQHEPFDYPVESSQAHFVITGLLGGNPVAAFEWTIRDRAGNEETVRRIVNISDRQPPYPLRKEPLQEIDFRGQKLSYYTSNPVQLLRWEPVESAKYYDLHLKRESITTIGPTTTLRLPVHVTSKLVDFALVDNGASVPVSANETFSWRVDTIDGIGQSSNYYGEADLQDPPEIIMFDRVALATAPDQVSVLKDGVEYNLDSYSTFATAPDFTLRFRPPEPLRIHNTNEKAWIEFYKHTACYSDLIDGNYDYKLSYDSIASLPVESDIFDFNFIMPEEEVNGCGIFHLAGFRDRAGNRMNDFSAQVKVDRGPKFEVKVFQNPVDPLSFTFIFKGIDYDGRNDMLLHGLDSTPPTPRATFRQAGFTEPLALELIPVRLTQVQDKQYAGAYTGSFSIDITLLGNVALQLQGFDLHGHEAREDVYLQVDTNRRLQRSESRLSLGRADDDFEGSYLYGYRRNADISSLAKGREGLEILNLPDFPWLYYPENLSLSAKGSRAVTGKCEQLIFVSLSDDGKPELPEQQINCDAAGNFTYTVESSRLNSVQLIRDFAEPMLEFPDENTDFEGGWNTIEVYSEDRQSGVSVVIMRLDQTEYLLENREPGVFSRRVALEPGRRDLQFEAIDRVGNRSVLQSSLQVLRPFGIDRCAVYPNPVRRDAFMECVFTRTPDNCRFRLFDTAGRGINIPQPVCGANIKERIYMEDLRGRQLANGVYFLRIQADYQGNKVEQIIKFAILR